jgi:hypothetical protein
MKKEAFIEVVLKVRVPLYDEGPDSWPRRMRPRREE